jgi:hypothetical protein
MVTSDFAEVCERRGDHRLPRVSGGLGENVRRTDIIGIRAVTADNATKRLSHSVFFCNLATVRTRSGSVARIDEAKSNTVLFGKLLNPINHLAVCPRRYRFPEILASVFVNGNCCASMRQRLVNNSKEVKD